MTLHDPADRQPDQADAPLIALHPLFAAGYAAGVRDGVVLGYAQAEDDQARAWSAVAGKVGRGPSFADLERRRYPGGRPERTCSLCGQPHRDGPRVSREAS